MNRRRWEIILWSVALVAGLGGWIRWARAVPARGPAPAPMLAAPPPPRPRDATLKAAAEVVASGNPFRLDRAPAPAASALPGYSGLGIGSPVGYPMPGGYTPPGSPYTPPGAPYTPPGAPRGTLSVTGIVGPPWEAVLEGIPGRQGAVVVRAGDRFDDIRIRSVAPDLVVVQGRDTTWRLKIKRSSP